MRNRWLSAAVALVLAVVGFGTLPALAQTTGTIEGTVADSNGAPLPGVSVEIRSPALQGTRTVVTDAQGRYKFPATPPGNYTVTASLSGFTKVEKTNVRVSLGAAVTLPITLSVSIKEEVVVTGEAPVVDTTKTVIGATTSIDTIQKLPLGRNFTSIATTVAGTGTSAGGGVTVYGATGLENQYIIDGLNTTGIKIGDQGKTMNNEFVQEVEVKTGGYEAEYSRALGGVINVVTKSGGNEFHGDLFGYYDAKGLAAGDKRVDDKKAVGQSELVLPKRLDVGLGIGGYLMKDRIWFYGAYDRVNRDQDLNARVGYVPATKTVLTRSETDETRTNLYSGKLTFRIGESNTVSASILGDPGTFNGELAAVIGPDTARLGENKFGGLDYAAKWDGIFGTQFLAQLQYGHHEEKSEDAPLSTGLSIRQARSGYSTFYVPGSGIPLYSREKYKRDAGKISGTGFFGSHEVKVGLDYESIDSSFFQGYGGGALNQQRLSAGSGAFSYSYFRYYAKFPLNCSHAYETPGDYGSPIITGNFGTPGAGNAAVPTVQDCAAYDVAQPGNSNKPKTENLGFFAQDSWKVLKNLTLNVGVRYDQQKLKDASGVVRIKLEDEWSPRIGVIWDFANNGKSKFYANYGRYYTVIPQDIQTRALGNEYTVFSYNYTQGVPGGTPDNVADPNVFPYAYIQGGQITPSGLKGMYQDEYIAGVEYELVKNWSFGIKGLYKSLGRAVEDRCDLTDPRLPYLASYIPQGSLTTCALVNPGEQGTLGILKDPDNPACYGPDGKLTGNCESTQVRRYYRGMELTATHRFASNFYMLASYLYSKLEGNYDGNEKQSTGQQDPNINADFDYIDLVPNNFGTLSLNRTHQFKLSGTYAFPFGLTVGTSIRYNTGAPFAVRGYARSGYFSERYLTPGRGYKYDLPAVYEADLHLEYNLRVGPVTITPVVDVFNLLNRQGVTGRDGAFNTVNAASNDPAHQIGQPGCTAANATYDNPACATNAFYMKDNAWQNPTQVRLGARVSF